MTNFFKTSLAAVALAAGFASLPAIANDTIEHTIKLSATVPTSDFAVVPKEGDWINETQYLTYNIVNQTLSSLEKKFTVVNTNGAINGKLASPASIVSGGNSIDLEVVFGSTTLTTTAQEVVTAANAAAPRDVSLLISATKPDSGYVPGTYTGNVQLEFDAVIADEA